MPTTRHRHQVTETPDIEHALDVAARRWPHEPRSRLLVRLVQAGSVALEHEESEVTRRRRAAADRTSGKYAGVFVDGYLAELRRDWPE
jgi:hypothetical protein